MTYFTDILIKCSIPTLFFCCHFPHSRTNTFHNSCLTTRLKNIYNTRRGNYRSRILLEIVVIVDHFYNIFDNIVQHLITQIYMYTYMYKDCYWWLLKNLIVWILLCNGEHRLFGFNHLYAVIYSALYYYYYCVLRYRNNSSPIILQYMHTTAKITYVT